jgi:hypothetical protein
MVDTGYVEATNKVILAGSARSTVEKELEEANMMPGMLVMKGADEDKVLINTAALKATGWLGYEDSATMWKPKDIDTAYAINARGAVVNGPGMVVRALRLASETIHVSDRLVGAAGGTVRKWVPVVSGGDAMTEETVDAIALEEGSGVASALLVRSLI